MDIAVDPVTADTIYVAAATGGVWKSKDRGARFTSIWPAANPQSMGALLITSSGTFLREPARLTRAAEALPMVAGVSTDPRRGQDMAACWANELWCHRSSRG